MKKLKLFNQHKVELEFTDHISIVSDEQAKEQADLLLEFIYCSLPDSVFIALAKRLEVNENRLRTIFDRASFKD